MSTFRRNFIHILTKTPKEGVFVYNAGNMSNGTIPRLYTKDFSEIKKGDKIALVVAVISLVVSLIALYLSFNDGRISKTRVQECNQIAIMFEKARHSPGDLEVTNQDVSSYLKNMATCLSDTNN